MKEKKESSLTNIFVYLLIVIFIILIAAPPLTRIFFSDDTNNNSNNNSNSNGLTSATALTCSREVTVGTMVYNVTITSNYGNDTLNKVTFRYDMPSVIDETVTDNPVLTEMNNLRSTGLVEENTTDTSTSFVLTRENKEANPTNTSLDSFFQPLDAQTTNLESLGYTCHTLTA